MTPPHTQHSPATMNIAFTARAPGEFDPAGTSCRFYLRFHRPVTRDEVRHAVWYTMKEHEPFRQWYLSRRRDVAQRVLDLFHPTSGECSICYSEEGGVHALNQCGHSFHPACLSKWLVKGGLSCPCCRSAINIGS